MTLITRNIGRLPVNLGDYDSSRAYGRKNRCLQYGCEVESLVENNTDAPFTWDGDKTFTLSANWRLISGNPEVWAAGNPKPASTGTTGDYPYNGMGRVVLEKNMVNIADEGDPENIVNLLTQEAFEDGEGNPLENTVFVIQYDFVLGEDIAVPANCVLEFDGGSISDDGTHTISGTPMVINESDKQIFNNVDIDIANNYANVVWFGAKGDNLTDNTDVFNYVFNKYLNVYIPNGYYKTGTINLTESFGNVSRHIKGDGLYSSPATNNQNITRLIYTGTDWLIKCSNNHRLENATIERLCFDIPTVCEGALYLNDIYYSTFKYIYVLGNGITTTKNIGICINGEGFNNTFDQLIITYVNKGIYIPYSGDDDYINTTTIGNGSNGSVYIGKATVGVEIQKGGVFFNGCTIENCSTAIKFNEVIQSAYAYIQSNISNCYFERNETVINVVSLSVANKLPLIVINNSELHNNTQVVTKSGSSKITFRNVAGVVRLNNALVMNPTQNSASRLEDSPYESFNRIQYEDGKTTQFHSQDVIHSIGPKSNNYDSNAYTSVKSSSMFLTYIPKRVVDLMFATPAEYYHTILLHKSDYSFPNNNGLYKIRLFITREGDSNVDSGGLDFNSDTCIVDLYANRTVAINGYEVIWNKTWFDSMFSNMGINWSPSNAATRKNLVLTLTVKSNPTAPNSGLLIMYEIDSYGMFGLQQLIQNFGDEAIALERTNVISWPDSIYDWTKLKWIYKESNSRIWKDSDNNIVYDFSS